MPCSPTTMTLPRMRKSGPLMELGPVIVYVIGSPA
jgi:hypothetical protein